MTLHNRPERPVANAVYSLSTTLLTGGFNKEKNSHRVTCTSSRIRSVESALTVECWWPFLFQSLHFHPARPLKINLNGPHGFGGVLLATALLQVHHRTLFALRFATLANRCDDLFDASVEICHC